MADMGDEISVDDDAEAPHPPGAEEQPNIGADQPQEDGEKPLDQDSEGQEWDADEHFAWDGQPPKKQSQRLHQVLKLLPRPIKRNLIQSTGCLISG